MAYALLFPLFHLALAAGLWVGLVHLGRARRGPAPAWPWWTMVAGAVLLTLCPMMVFVVFVGGTGTLAGVLSLFSVFAFYFGTSLFVAGFAFHGMKTLRLHERLAQLEQVTSAMGEQISRLEGFAKPAATSPQPSHE